MKRSYAYLLLGLIVAGVLGFTLIRYKNKSASAEYFIKDRKGTSGNSNEWVVASKTATQLNNQLRTKPDDNKSRLALAELFIREGRITGDHIYYDVAAMKQVNEVLKNDPKNFEALLYKSLLLLSQHHFANGLKVAEDAQKINPHNAFVHGILVDGNVEMGNYEAAVENSDKMVSIRPDIRSYSRISYLREIHGDLPGAIEAMKMAVQAGLPGDESTEWARVQLGKLYEYAGDMKNAEVQYIIALEQRQDYAYALAGLARVASSSADYKKAIQLYERADSMMNDYAFKEELIELYETSGDKAKSKELSKIVIDGMSNDAKSGETDENIGHYADRELAYAYVADGNFDKALDHALLEYNRRPDNIDVNEVLAWVHYKKKDYGKALSYIKVALRTNSANPVLLSRAGLIYLANGDKVSALSYLQKGLEKNPNISITLKMEAKKQLENLNPGTVAK